jgi:hypothetical protein
MKVTRSSILSKLPPYQDKWVTVANTQNVGDIIADIVKSHYLFAPYYDKFAYCFSATTVEEICDKLVNFCKENIQYREENEDLQSTALPTGIIERGHGDCKHYASFIGGCLSAISRETGVPINWKYCFASYKIEQRTPYHVFVVVETPSGTVWCDPTPGADGKEPSWIVYKKINENKIPAPVAVGRISGIPAPYTNLSASQFNSEVASGQISLDAAQVVDALGSNGPAIKACADRFASTAAPLTTAAQATANQAVLQQTLQAFQSAPGGQKGSYAIIFYTQYAVITYGYSVIASDGTDMTNADCWLQIYHNDVWQQINQTQKTLNTSYLNTIIKANDSRAIAAIPALVTTIATGNISALAAAALGQNMATVPVNSSVPSILQTPAAATGLSSISPWLIIAAAVLGYILITD